jgi:hypothetical protein
MKEPERGSTTPLLAIVVVAVGGLCVGLGHLGADADAAARAQTAADAAALAGAADGLEAARRLAVANGAEVVEMTTSADGDEVHVIVRVRGVQAQARAVREPVPRGKAVAGTR